jgi:hypothetical protein
MSAPKGPASISSIVLPSPSVVVGDSMRDSTGAVAPLSLNAFDANDVPLLGLTSQFFITDSLAAARIDKNNVIIGEKQGTIHVVGQIGGVQSAPALVPITVAPTLLALTGKIDTLVVPFAGDTTSLSTGSEAMSVTLRGAGDTASLGFVVRFQLTSAPPTIQGPIPGVFVSENGTNVSPVDTTDATGASRKLVVRAWLLADKDLQAGNKVDSAVVVVSTSYKGRPVFGSPIRIVIPIKVKITTTP